MPTGAIHTWSGKKLEPFQRPQDAVLLPVKLPVSVTYARGTVLGEVAATPGTFKAYNPSNTDGSEVARGILAYDAASDSSGNIGYTTTAGGAGEWGERYLDVPMYVQGIFKTSELTGLDEGALGDMGGALISGTIADGIARIG